MPASQAGRRRFESGRPLHSSARGYGFRARNPSRFAMTAALCAPPAQAGPKPMMTWVSGWRGRNRTDKPAVRASSGIPTTRPSSDTPSSSLTTATAYGASGSRPRGGIRMTVNETTLPLPLSATSSQRRSWQLGQSSFGGMASCPQFSQRIAESRPSRASSKKPLSVITRSVTAKEAHQHRGGVPAEGVHEARRRAVDLSRPGFAAELRDDLPDLRGAGGPDGVALGLEAPGGVDDDLAAEARPSLLGGESARARLEEAEALGGHDLRDREAVVQLRHLHVA